MKKKLQWHRNSTYDMYELEISKCNSIMDITKDENDDWILNINTFCLPFLHYKIDSSKKTMQQIKDESVERLKKYILFMADVLDLREEIIKEYNKND